MNPNLTFKYEDMDIPGWKGTRCIIGIVDGEQFTSLGLEKNQTQLTQQQIDWLEKHGDEVVRLVKAVADVWALYKEASTLPKLEQEAKLNEYRKAMKAKHKLLDKFCHDCKIKDS